MKLQLETERLILRQFKAEDLDTFLAYRNDPDVARYQGWQYPYPREKAVEFIQEMSTAIPAHNNWLQVALELKSTGQLIGDVAFFIMRQDERQAMIGYSLARLFWGNGYAFEAVSGLLAFLFDEMDLHRVSLRVRSEAGRRTDAPRRGPQARARPFAHGCARVPGSRWRTQ